MTPDAVRRLAWGTALLALAAGVAWLSLGWVVARRCASSPPCATRWQAQRAAPAIGRRDVPTLVARLNAGVGPVDAARALGEMRSAARDAGPALLEAVVTTVRTGDLVLALEAAVALERIGASDSLGGASS